MATVTQSLLTNTSYLILLKPITAWEVSKYGVFSGLYFPTFGLNTERYSVSLRIQSECRKIRTRKNSVSGHFSRRANSSGGKLFLEIGDPVQNYKELYKAYNKKGCRIVPIPARSPDINSVENVFNNVRSKLRTDEWKQEIRYGPYERFCERVCTFKTANIERLTFLLPFSRQEIHEKSTKNEGF